eukprot:TRINITY_DN1777_c0_g1_i1.p1 TRINITY_DN1777_c0_g1~~TRINITY_DN1777_c0_g1_i1.p1  ORF type:complete len:367 (-),score=101.22 TRINITY_DN1777_c0_g1_i1:113-1213(-)
MSNSFNNFRGGGGGGPAPYLPPPPGHRPPPPQYLGSGYQPSQQQSQQAPPSQHQSPAQSYSLPPMPTRHAAPAPQPFQQHPQAPSPASIFLGCLQSVRVNDAITVLQALQASGLSIPAALDELERTKAATPTPTKTVVVTEETEDEIVIEKTRKNYQPGLYFGGAPTGGTPVTKSSSSSRPGGQPGIPANNSSSGAFQIPLPKLPPKPSASSHPPRPQQTPTSRYEEEGSKFTPHAQSELIAMLTEEKFIYHHVKGAVGYIAPVGMGGIKFVDECFEFNEDGTYIFEKFLGSEGHEELNKLVMRWRGTYTVDSKRTVLLRWDTYDMNLDYNYSGQELKDLSTQYARLVVGVDRTLRSPIDPNAIFV